MFHGTNNQVAPYTFAEKLFEVAPKPQTTFIIIEGCKHGDLINSGLYRSKIKATLKQHQKSVNFLFFLKETITY
tara:strand:+ start:5329 stop:5550 length:222 start_codon:yes stop_codon:yes gene_type:complete